MPDPLHVCWCMLVSRACLVLSDHQTLMVSGGDGDLGNARK